VRIDDLLTVPVARLQERFKGREPGVRAEAPLIVRLDGVGFSRLSEFFEAPRDPRVHRALVEAALVIMRRYGLWGVHVFSDELNLYLMKSPPYAGRITKLCSIPASIAAAEATLRLGIPVYFDGRTVSLSEPCEARDYALFRMRVGLGNYSRLLAGRLGVSIPERMGLRSLLEKLRERGVRVEADWRSTGSFAYRLQTPEGRGELRVTEDPGEFLDALNSLCSQDY